MRHPRPRRDLIGAVLIACAAIGWSLASGSEPLSLGQLWAIVTGADRGIHADIVLGLRAPRTLVAFACGGLLAFAGALMQVMLRNPLADPYVLGLAGGAGAGALAAILAGLSAAAVLGGAWVGALASVCLVIWFGRRSLMGERAQAEDPLRLLLGGVAAATGWAALIVLMLALAPDASLRGMLFWLIGDLDGAESYVAPMIGLLVAAGLGVIIGRDLNVLVRGPDLAHTLGVSVGRVRLILLIVASGATALAVSTAGTIGFVGLIVPNAMRLISGNDQRLLLPLCALVGGALLTLADTIARTVVAPSQLPVGAVIALAGVPAFIWLLGRQGHVR